jgi:ABC-type transport system involved in multi-copper enzyme maturation permease subunit
MAADLKLLQVMRNTFLESVRDRVLYNLIVFALLMIGSSLVVGQLAIRGEPKIIVDLGLSSIRIFGLMIAVFLGIQLVYKEIERKTIYSILSKPVSRPEFLLGKYFGLGLTLVVNCGLMLVGLMVVLAVMQQGPTRLAWAAVPAAYAILLELLVITAVALTLSTLSSPALSAIVTVLVWVAGSFSTNFLDMANRTRSPITSAVLYAIYYFFPNLSNFNFIQDAAYGRVATPIELAYSSAYALCYVGLLISVAILVFQRRDFK